MIEYGVLTDLIIIILLLAECALEIHVALPMMWVIVIVLKLFLSLVGVIVPVLIP